MQTAVDYLQDEILHDRTIKAKSIKEWNDVISKAKEMEKQQIIDANLIGLITSLETKASKQATEYYNETYGSKGSDAQRIYGEHTITILEISDEEIMEGIIKHCKIPHDRLYAEINAMIEGAKWYREQLKKKQ